MTDPNQLPDDPNEPKEHMPMPTPPTSGDPAKYEPNADGRDIGEPQ